MLIPELAGSRYRSVSTADRRSACSTFELERSCWAFSKLGFWDLEFSLPSVWCFKMAVAAPTQPTSPLTRPVTTLWGVGPERASHLARLEVRTIEDLLLHRPRRYEDRRHFVPVAQLQLD